jgi:hypothetical protein
VWVAADGVEYMGYAIRTDRYRYVEWHKRGDQQVVAKELYDHSVDPGENKNVAGLAANTDLVRELSKKLKDGWRAARPASA